MNRWCHHSPPLSNIVPVLSRKYQWRKWQRAGESPSSVKRRKTVDQMAFLGQVQYCPVSINRPEFDIYPSTAKMIPVWLVFNPERNHYVLYRPIYRNGKYQRYRPVRYEIVFLEFDKRIHQYVNTFDLSMVVDEVMKTKTWLATWWFLYMFLLLCRLLYTPCWITRFRQSIGGENT